MMLAVSKARESGLEYRPSKRLSGEGEARHPGLLSAFLGEGELHLALPDPLAFAVDCPWRTRISSCDFGIG